MKSKLLLTCLLICSSATIVLAQLNSCIVTFSTTVNNQPVILRSESGVLMLNSKSGDLILRVNSSSLISETDSFGTMFHLPEKDIIFTGNFQSSSILQLVNQQGNSGRTYPITGTLDINSQSLQMNANYSMLKINNQREELSRNLKMSLFITFPAATAKLNKYYPGISDIMIQVNEATTNIVEE
jgi:hypothetical protein